ncbi:unnamed protein product [Brachionus calyciflorus]|uniref:G-protein coupled receptors family 1 profile domain-containing protein n=1 Tax=Brachionus calyciflorus TaxID=104777 RepID=A0A813QY72_9BILA|nr:unnamed protein product [Brachionus calyciflorus]
MLNDTINFLNKTLGIISLLLFVFGIIGNLLAYMVCRRKALKNISTFKFIMLICINDIFGISVWNLDIFLNAFFDFVHESLSWWWCKICVFLQYFCLQYSAWILVCLSVDRYLKVRINSWRKIYSTSKNTATISFIVGLLIFIVNSHLLILNGYSDNKNGTEIVRCYSPKFFFNHISYIPFWHKVHVYLYSIIPFCILLVINSLLIFKSLKPVQQIGLVSKRRKEKSKTLTYTIVALILMFFCSSLPYSIVTAYWYMELIGRPIGVLILNALSVLSFSYHSLNFVIFLFTNVKFWQECQLMFKRK